MATLKLRIDNEALAQEFFEDAVLIGIVAPVKDYLFTWQINQLLGFNFRLNNDLEIQLTKKDRKYFFSIFSYQVPGLTLMHYLYNNQHDGEYLLPEFKHLDFLWLIKGDEQEPEAIQQLLQTLRNLPGVQLVLEMTHEKIRNKQHLIF